MIKKEKINKLLACWKEETLVFEINARDLKIVSDNLLNEDKANLINSLAESLGNKILKSLPKHIKKGQTITCRIEIV